MIRKKRSTNSPNMVRLCIRPQKTPRSKTRSIALQRSFRPRPKIDSNTSRTESRRLVILRGDIQNVIKPKNVTIRRARLSHEVRPSDIAHLPISGYSANRRDCISEKIDRSEFSDATLEDARLVLCSSWLVVFSAYGFPFIQY